MRCDVSMKITPKEGQQGVQSDPLDLNTGNSRGRERERERQWTLTDNDKDTTALERVEGGQRE